MSALPGGTPGATARNPKREMLVQVTRHLEEHGVDGQSLRAIATGIGTSHRMLIYHFDSRDGLLTAVVDGLWRHLDEDFQELLDTAETDDVRDAAVRFWSSLARSEALAPLFFELSAMAMRGAPWAEAFRSGATAWTQRLTDLLATTGLPVSEARVLARTTLHVVRGGLWDGAITADRAGADEAVRAFLTTHWPGLPRTSAEEPGSHDS